MGEGKIDTEVEGREDEIETEEEEKVLEEEETEERALDGEEKEGEDGEAVNTSQRVIVCSSHRPPVAALKPNHALLLSRRCAKSIF